MKGADDQSSPPPPVFGVYFTLADGQLSNLSALVDHVELLEAVRRQHSEGARAGAEAWRLDSY